MLGALHALKAAIPTSGSFSKRIVFLALAGEPWAYMGSRRLLYEASTGSNATAGLDLSLVEKVSVGPASLVLVTGAPCPSQWDKSEQPCPCGTCALSDGPASLVVQLLGHGSAMGLVCAGRSRARTSFFLPLAFFTLCALGHPMATTAAFRCVGQ
jgi:hypothetical protein